MQIDILFRASALDPAYLEEAEHSLETLLQHAYRKQVLYHQFLYGRVPTQQALLEDYAFLVRALLSGYAYTFKEPYLELADTLAAEAVKRFYREGRWYLSDDGFDSPADLSDRYYTSQLSVMIGNLLGLAALQENLEQYALAETTLHRYAYLLDRNPSHYPEATRAMLRYKTGDVVLKANREKLEVMRAEIGQIGYPYLLVKPEAALPIASSPAGSAAVSPKPPRSRRSERRSRRCARRPDCRSRGSRPCRTRRRIPRRSWGPCSPSPRSCCAA